MYQGLWLLGLDWDENLPEEIKNEWDNYRTLLQQVELIRIPRWLNFDTATDGIQLHGFCDASEAAYAAVVFVRIKKGETYHTQFLTSKTRVAPTDQISLPRLELSGAWLLAKLIANVKASLDLSENNIYAWSDSTITLSWIKGHPSKWKTFVANRVVKIQELTTPSIWKNELKSNRLWWCGAEWLANLAKSTRCNGILNKRRK